MPSNVRNNLFASYGRPQVNRRFVKTINACLVLLADWCAFPWWALQKSAYIPLVLMMSMFLVRKKKKRRETSYLATCLVCLFTSRVWLVSVTSCAVTCLLCVPNLWQPRLRIPTKDTDLPHESSDKCVPFDAVGISFVVPNSYLFAVRP